jgi:hypothetical protein
MVKISYFHYVSWIIWNDQNLALLTFYVRILKFLPNVYSLRLSL